MERLKEKYSFEGGKIKGSRFIVNLSPIFSSQEAKQFLQEIEALFPDAKHHCYAYRLSNGQFRVSDCGEPRGSAGLPILQRLEGEDLVDTMVVVTRYFGGTKLGFGGLIRAYGNSAAQALKEGLREKIILGENFELEFSYADSPIVSSIIKRFTGELKMEEYGERIKHVVFIRKDRVSIFEQEIIERSSNRISIKKI